MATKTLASTERFVSFIVNHYRRYNRFMVWAWIENKREDPFLDKALSAWLKSGFSMRKFTKENK